MIVLMYTVHVDKHGARAWHKNVMTPCSTYLVARVDAVAYASATGFEAAATVGSRVRLQPTGQHTCTLMHVAKK